VSKRIPNTFPEVLSPDIFHQGIVSENEVVVDWVLKK